jgi:hypothetical protein
MKQSAVVIPPMRKKQRLQHCESRRKNCSSGSVTFDSAIKGRMLFGRGYYSKFKNSIFYIFLGEANIACCGLTHLLNPSYNLRI